MINRPVKFLLCLLAGFGSLSVCTAQERVEHSLNGTWELQVDSQTDWREAKVPGTFEEQIAIDFDGVATCRKSIEPIEIDEHRRLLLHFDAVATHATVWFNGQQVGEHLGGWTPFRFDVTEAAKAKPEGPWEINVKVEERVGHNTQGFLPIIAPHFGGIWQGVKLIDVPADWIDETRVWAYFDIKQKELCLEIPFTTSQRLRDFNIEIRALGNIEWHPLTGSSGGELYREHLAQRKQRFEIDVTDKFLVIDLERWSPDNPALYELRINLKTRESRDSVIHVFGLRDLRIEGSRFLLNDQLVKFRGLLNWGYAPPRTAPSLDEDFMRKEIQFAKDRGFNLMKFCLWIPPKRYLELCDEMGMFAWVEYPTWHPDFSENKLVELKKEYDEFFFHDRSHSSVVLRSLTCETGLSADLTVIQSLYDQCKERVPGAIVVDDSSWIEWNRVFDFYDDHPYGNNHTWVGELTKLKQFIAEREPKPLMLGEAIAADTWTDPAWFSRSNETDDHWQPNFLEPSRTWLADAAHRYGEDAVSHLAADSKTYAMLMRKFQMETFRREVPDGGYVVSVIRDMPLAAMGLMDYRGEPKWKPDDWTWHKDKMLLLQTENDRRSYFSGERLSARLAGAGFPDSKFDDSIQIDFGVKSGESIRPQLNRLDPDGHGRPVLTAENEIPIERQPTRYELVATTTEGKRVTTFNHWPMWVFPKVRSRQAVVFVHKSLMEWVTEHDNATAPFEIGSLSQEPQFGKPTPVLTSIIDSEVLDLLKVGNPVILLANNEPNSFPLQSHWFLRGGPIVSKKCAELFPREMLVELQQFDMAGDVIRDIKYLDDIDPLFMLWEAHDLDHIKTNGLLFHMPVGQSGNLFVSALKHTGKANAAGSFVLQKLIDEMTHGQLCQDLADPERGKKNLDRLRLEIQQRKIMLHDRNWKFQPDPDETGASGSWFAVDHDDSRWQKIRIDRSWESQGYGQLDHWAWYRHSVDIPADWNSQKTFLNFTGVDDYYDVFVNGTRVGSGGDIEKRETAFEMRSSHEITGHVTPGKPIQITVAVYDWYGAGGIFRPVWISSQPIADKPRMLK